VAIWPILGGVSPGSFVPKFKLYFKTCCLLVVPCLTLSSTLVWLLTIVLKVWELLIGFKCFICACYFFGRNKAIWEVDLTTY
jgi:hypothetical protein